MVWSHRRFVFGCFASGFGLKPMRQVRHGGLPQDALAPLLSQRVVARHTGKPGV